MPKRHIPILMLTVILCAACGSKTSPDESDDEVLFAVGEAVLTRSDVERLIPAGISKEDSIRMFDAIVERNFKSMLLQEVALRNLTHPEEIKQKVNDYRNRLIIAEYEKEMADAGASSISEKKIKAYYSAHHNQMKLTEPLVKGIYLKTRSTGYELDNLRRWLQKADASSVDNIEKNGLSAAEEYDHFTDRWVAWHTVAEVIPDTPADRPPHEAIEKVYETSRNGSTYMLRVTEMLPPGSEMPYDYAKAIISETLGRESRTEYERRLMASLCKKALKDRKLHIGSYNPANKIITTTTKN